MLFVNKVKGDPMNSQISNFVYLSHKENNYQSKQRKRKHKPENILVELVLGKAQVWPGGNTDQLGLYDYRKSFDKNCLGPCST